jgi:hypothetical protein
MALWDISSLAADNDFALRTTAAYAVESESGSHEDPPTWQAQHSWDMAAQPGFGDAYASALASGVQRPGQDPAVISDAQISAAVQSLLTPPA